MEELDIKDYGQIVNKNGEKLSAGKIYKCNAEKLQEASDVEHIYNLGIRQVLDIRVKEQLTSHVQLLKDAYNIEYTHSPVFECAYPPKKPDELALSYLNIPEDMANTSRLLDYFATHQEGILIICNEGNPRAEIIQSLIYLVCDVDIETIEEQLAEVKDIGEYLTMFHQEYQSMENYCTMIGKQQQYQKIKENMIG